MSNIPKLCIYAVMCSSVGRYDLRF